MKIILINNLYKPFERGGAEKYVEKLVDNFLKKEINVSVITTKPFFAKKGKEENIYYLNSFYFYLNKLPSFLKFFWHLFNIFNFLKFFQVNNILKKERPDIVITNNLMGLGFLIPALLYIKKIKHAHVLHDVQLLHPSGLVFLGKEDILDSLFGKVYQKINSFLFSRVKYVVAPSNWIINLHTNRNFFKEAKKNKIFNPVDQKCLFSKTKNSDLISFIYVGQLEKHKGIEELLDTFNKIEMPNNINLKIVGGGSLEESLKQKYHNKNIIFLGKLSRDLVLEKMLESDCLISPSLCYENSPSVIYEAALCGLDFIYSDLGGSVEIGAYFKGDSFSPQNINNLTKKIINYKPKKNNFYDKKKILHLSIYSYVGRLFDFLEINQKHF